jgi:predicted metal-binding membrane protein
MNSKGHAFSLMLSRDTWPVTAALVSLVALAWAYLAWLHSQMEASQAMAGMSGMTAMMMPQPAPWSVAHLSFLFAMWAVMMVGMMTPSAAPMVLIYGQVVRQAATLGKPFAPSGWFASGYLLAWTLFSAVAAACQTGLERAALLSPTMAVTSSVIAGVVLIDAGLYQFSSLKNACLAHCRAPLSFIQRHGGFRSSVAGTLRLGFLHGLYCIGCCWALMALLFVVGVMNLLWIAAFAAFVLVEKIIPGGTIVSRLAGIIAIGSGIWVIATAASW